MKKNSRDTVSTVANGGFDAGENSNKTNGDSVAVAQPTGGDLSVILAGLQTMRDGDFSVRLPGSWTGLAGKVADTFNDIVSTNQQISQELKRAGQVVGKEGRTREGFCFHPPKGAWPGMEFWVTRLTDNLV